MKSVDDWRFLLTTVALKVRRAAVVAEEVEVAPSTKNKALLKVMADRLDEWYDTFTENLSKLAAFNIKNGIEEDLEQLVVPFETDYYQAKAVLTGLRSEDRPALLSTGSDPLQASSSHIQLPKLRLPEFAGSLKDWHGFAEMFKATVHESPSLNDIQRHAYLRASLQGEALALVATLPLTGPNYAVAWGILIQHYDDSHLQTNYHLEVLHTLPATSPNPAHIRTFAGKIAESIGALKALGHDVEGWVVPLLFLFCKKLHNQLREEWETRIIESPATEFNHFVEFLHERARVLESTNSTRDQRGPGKPADSRPRYRGISTLVTNTKPSSPSPCLYCGGLHPLAACGSFRRESPSERVVLIKTKRLCLSCLLPGHFANQCTRRAPCKLCPQRHHTLCHLEPLRSTPEELVSPARTPSSPSSPPVDALQVGSPTAGQVIVATALGRIADSQGNFQEVRILIDPASQATFITRSCVQRLGLQLREADVPVLGMGHTPLGVCREKVFCRFESQKTVELQLDALVVNHITRAPASPFPPLPAARTLRRRLADPLYFRPSDVDVLLGAEWFAHVVLGRPERGPPGTPSLMETIWGHCLIGRHEKADAAVSCALLTQNENVSEVLQRFWEIEEPPQPKITRPEDDDAETHYQKSVYRLSSGRYVVSLPFLPNHPPLKDSRQAALRRFLMLERRLYQNPSLRRHYCDFMRDYIEQGHMQVVSERPPDGHHYYIPHHAVYRADALGAIEKFRVVFDSSMKTTTGTSLNQSLLTGPKLQADLVDILVRFRLHSVVLIADIRQMYRNIMMRPEDRDFQRILWRPAQELPLLEYHLSTVTYGVSSSPFLAIRTLQQLVEDEGASYPIAAQALREDTYMDDIVTSLPSESEALQLQRELVELTGRAGFELRKWMSNSRAVLQAIPLEHHLPGADLQLFESQDEPTTKILGLVWRPNQDVFSYQICDPVSRITKRTIMGDVAKLFDPIGFITPVVFVGKLLLRHLWDLGISWDDEPPLEVCQRWQQFRGELKRLEEFALPRCMDFDRAISRELHGFADASEKGYAGVVYLRCSYSDGSTQVSLVMAKSKVAPLKTCSLPRLELCGVELVTRLLRRVASQLSSAGGAHSLTVWTDSMVALHWLRSPPYRWKTFVANRVSAAQERVKPESFRHVPSASNPADCASRGLLPTEILCHDLWLRGPPWLRQHPNTWPSKEPVEPTQGDPEVRVVTLLMDVPRKDESSVTPQSIFQRYSSLSMLLRTVSWILRFAHNTSLRHRQGTSPLVGPLQLSELRAAMVVCIRLTQGASFPSDLSKLSQGKLAALPLRRLSPWLSPDGILRVGGRLRHSALSNSQKFPIILPKVHAFTSMVIDYHHIINGHAGPSALRVILHRSFWIMACQSAIHARLARCITCFRCQPRAIQPPMADLPAERIEAGKPFAVTGLDYGGPFEITMSRIRKAKILKAHICLFVCFKTKAVHLELASDLSTDAFMAALKRFVARRGAVTAIYSDHGTNFVGARRKLNTWSAVVNSDQYQGQASRFANGRHIEWKMIPAGTPHMGGIWEAGIKSTKRLLARTMGQQLLTYEEFYTVLTQVEASLNSRPLTPLSTDPNDLQALTPGHFLLMEPPSVLEEPAALTPTVRLRDRWHLLTQLYQSFWHRWSLDYLNTLQQRNKWTSPAPVLKEGMLVVIRDEHAPPLSWRLGRVHRVLPGRDQHVRAAEVRTANGIITRGTVKLCPLPQE